MNTVTQRILGWTFLILTLFGVLFDPSEAALGSQYITLSDGLLTLAGIIGNVLWILGMLYILVIIGAVMVMVNEDTCEKAVAEAREKGTLKGYKKKWYELPQFVLYMTFAVTAIGSGFWFTGTAWVLGLVAVRALRAKIRTDFKDELEKLA